MFHEVSAGLYEHVALSDLSGVARQCLRDAKGYKIWLLSGEMGAGKTTFVKALCHQLGVTDTMGSPTFSIINEYAAPQGKVYHFDFFRIKNEAEAFDIGSEEYFFSGNYCFIEWPEKVAGIIPDTHVSVELTLESETLRTIALSVNDGKEKNRI
jgi:tRNA threonylcarbamoyladenosine biosynthesis protein TsaE